MSRGRILFLLLFPSLLYLFATTTYHLWKPDEPRYAEVAREMAERKSYVIPILEGKIYYDKPPLFFDLIAASYKAFKRIDELSARFPSAFFSILSVLILYIWGYRFLGGISFLSSLILATSLEFVWIARRANMDNVLTFFVLVSLLSFLDWRKSGKLKYLIIFYLSIGLGLVVKGPLALVIPLGSAAIFLLIKRERRSTFFRIMPIGLALSFTLPFLWLLLGYLKAGWSYPKILILKHALGMYFTGWSHPRPIYYYLVNLPLNFLPWSFFFPLMAYQVIRKKPWENEEVLFFLTVFLFSFVFLSLSKAKRELYLLPAYPALSVAAAWAISEAKLSQIRKTSLFFLIFLVMLSISIPKLIPKLAPKLKPCVFSITLSLIIPFLFGSMAYRRGRNMIFLFPFFAASLVFFGSTLVLPHVDRYKFPGKVIESLKGAEEPIFLYLYRNYQFHFYLRRSDIGTVGDREVKSMIKKGEPFFLVVRSKHLRPYMLELEVVAVSEMWDGRVYLLRFSGYNLGKTGG